MLVISVILRITFLSAAIILHLEYQNYNWNHQRHKLSYHLFLSSHVPHGLHFSQCMRGLLLPRKAILTNYSSINEKHAISKYRPEKCDKCYNSMADNKSVCLTT